MIEQLISPDGVYRVVFLRTLRYVVAAVVLCVIVGYPVAYYVSRLRGRMRGLVLALLVLPFWISYLMRMLAWVGLLNEEGLVNRMLTGIGILQDPYPWLEGKSITVIFGLVYGYVPFFILPLFAALDRLQNSYLEAAWDLGASSFSTFRRVTLPLSKNGILAGIAIIMLPMFGDFYTAYLLSNGRSSTAMIGNSIQSLLQETTFGYAQARGAALVTVLAAVRLAPHAVLHHLDRPQHEGGGADMSIVGNLSRTRGASTGSSRVYTWLYIVWAIVPVVIAIGFSFNAGRSRSVWQGFSLEWWTGQPRPRRCSTTRS